MADKQVSAFVGNQLHHSGKTINVYSGTYAQALAHGSAGLATIKTLNPLDGTGTAITQVAKTTGLVADENGMATFIIDDATTPVYLMATDQFGPPRLVNV